MTDLETRLRAEFGERAAAVWVDGEPPAALLHAVHRRRRLHATVGTALAVTAALFVAVAVPRVIASERPAEPFDGGHRLSRSAPSVSLLPPSPINALRRDASGVWTGKEFVVWGGARVSAPPGSGTTTPSPGPYGPVFADGAAYDPAAQHWRKLATSPLGPRAGHAAVWTGNAMFVWGGSGFGGATPARIDGALYDPVRDSWRRIADAPKGSTGLSATAVLSGAYVVVGAGDSPLGRGPSRVLIYDLRRDRWHTLDVGAHVYALTSRGADVVALTWTADFTSSPANYSLGVAVIDPATATVTMRADLPLTPADEPTLDGRIGLAWTGERLFLATTTFVNRAGDQQSRVYDVNLSAGAAQLMEVAHGQRTDFVPPLWITMDPNPDTMVWTGDRLLAYADSSFGEYLPGDSKLHAIAAKGMGNYCSSSAATAWGDGVLYAWSGQKCQVDAPSPIDGVAVRFR